MNFSSCRIMIFLVVCMLFFCIQPEKVSGLGSIDLALRLHRGDGFFLRSSRILNSVASEDLNVQLNLAPAPAMMCSTVKAKYGNREKWLLWAEMMQKFRTANNGSHINCLKQGNNFNRTNDLIGILTSVSLTNSETLVLFG
ncbi:hypothetical protein ACH5RR_007706 [Cinchona calisaya]|uniref:Uncharacterized protein n=1 Tax=Cinchona calisaya TaxID=153742 RepID=A0ABD3A9L0_9GENT